MSGFIAGFGKPKLEIIHKSFEKITHRGPYMSGIINHKKAILAQNYLQADTLDENKNAMVPISSEDSNNLMIGYDGQIGNWPQLLSQFNIEDGPFREERLLLRMYQKLGKEILQYLSDAIFAFIITDGDEFFAARDLLGIKTLFYTKQNGTIYFSSELKGLIPISENIHEFPEAHFMEKNGHLERFSELPKKPPEAHVKDIETFTKEIREIILRSVKNRVDFFRPTAGLLSGGMDSSVICYLSSQLYREKYGNDARLKTFSIGVGESGDIKNARLMADHIDSDHHELIVDLNHVLEALPDVIYYLESFDPSLVRSSVSNYLISKYAKQQGIEVLLSGEGGDEIFCGYTYLKDFAPEELVMKQIECLGFLHNNASLRLDRMNQCNSIKVIAPLISGELLNHTFHIPPQYKQNQQGDEKIDKWIFRKAFENILPSAIIKRPKQEFSQGSGSAAVLPNYLEGKVTDADLASAQAKYPFIRSKEEYYYFRIFTEHFGTGRAFETVGQWILL
ncbi:MAG: asparagine synthase-related protein [bacterium]